MIKRVKDYVAFSKLNKEYRDIKKFCDNYLNTTYTINKDYSVDVHGNAYLRNAGLTKIPVKFNKIDGKFDCSLNELTSLKNCPNIVNGDFDFEENQITSLEYFPTHIQGKVNGSHNQITDISKIQNMNIKSLDLERNYLTNISPEQYKYTRTNRCPIDRFLGILSTPHLLDIRVFDVTKKQELCERVEEFEVIKNGNEIDMISLNSLFDYYDKKFLKDFIIEKIQLIKYSDTTVYRIDIDHKSNDPAYIIINQ